MLLWCVKSSGISHVSRSLPCRDRTTTWLKIMLQDEVGLSRHSDRFIPQAKVSQQLEGGEVFVYLSCPSDARKQQMHSRGSSSSLVLRLGRARCVLFGSISICFLEWSGLVSFAPPPHFHSGDGACDSMKSTEASNFGRFDSIALNCILVSFVLMLPL